MNKANLKSYAPQARKDFIAAVTARANSLGLSDKAGTLEVAPAQTQGDIAVIAGQAWPAKVSGQRDRLIERIRKDGFSQTMEAIAYTWFNRFAALRYMELHDYLGHGHRALSSTSGGLPDILTYATDLASELPGLNAAKVTELKLAGNRDGELYRMLLVAQCNALSIAMPFLFERIDDDSELLLPDNLLRSDSVIAKLVAEIPEEDWAEVEIIGWLYQFYISEKKDQVIGKVVKSEDIPAATQLFTPNWIVQYLVQNSVGRLWLMANPQSTLAREWPYYITPAEQTPEVQAQLDALIQTRVREDGDTLNPESITVLDPACGSGHILVVAYDVLKAIYLERGYQPRAIPRLILEKNLYGLDIDDRAAQMAGFALLMKARADDRRLFTATDDAGNLQPPKLNVLSLQESKGLSVDELATHLSPFNMQRATIAALVETFEHAKTFGSLIQIPDALKTQLTALPQVLALVKQSGDMYASSAADGLLPLVKQAQILAIPFDSVVVNPPYMGIKGTNPDLTRFLTDQYESGKSDLMTAFLIAAIHLLKPTGLLSGVTLDSWMFLSSYEALRGDLLSNFDFESLVHIGWNTFPEGHTYNRGVTFTFTKFKANQKGAFLDLSDVPATVDKNELFLERLAASHSSLNTLVASDFSRIPGSLIAYWVTEKWLEIFKVSKKLLDVGSPRQGLATADNNRFLRHWTELKFQSISFNSDSRNAAITSGKTWFPYNKGGAYRKWYGNHEWVVNWGNDGVEIRAYGTETGGRAKSVVRNPNYYFKRSLSWSKVTSSGFSLRMYPTGFIFDVAGCSIFIEDQQQEKLILGVLNSKIMTQSFKRFFPTINLEVGQIADFPVPEDFFEKSAKLVDDVVRLVDIAKSDWDSQELSWNFNVNHLIGERGIGSKTLASVYNQSLEDWHKLIEEMKSIEEKLNHEFINIYRLGDELQGSVSISDITLLRNPEFRPIAFGEGQFEVVAKFETCRELISYIVGCVMGRYSLDEPGLIYAHAGNIGFDPSRYATFPADADGIVPITDELWFADDAPSRIREFLRAVWGPDTLEENMSWLAESLGTKASETPDETIRRYIADKFFKDHLQTYKKRPIYWLFSSGKQGAFQALVYLHRYNEGTLSRLRAEYVVPLTSKIQSRIEMLQKDTAAATSTAARTKLVKEVEKLNKKHAELLAYDEKLRHYADMRISLDLDDGVKVNYGKFGDLLEGVKIVTGGSADD